MESLTANKDLLRKEALKIRKNLSISRKNAASKAALQKLQEITSSYRNVLSFASTNEEINLWPINIFLAMQKKLLLPRMEKNKELSIYQVEDIKNTLIKNSKINILEPNPTFCKKFNPHDIFCAFIPGLIFDNFHHRLGYGMGCYDRFLGKFPYIKTIGIGFYEQKKQEKIPTNTFDIALDEILLF